MFGFRPPQPPPQPPPPPPTLTFKQSLLIYCAVGLLILLIYASLANFKRQNVSFGRSWDARLQTLAVFSGSLQLFIPLIGISFWVIVKALLASNYTAAAAVLYLAWAYLIDDSPVSGSRRPWLRRYSWWEHYADFFPLTLVKTAALDPSQTYVFGYHPHGIISVGAFGAFATNGARCLDISGTAADQGAAASVMGARARDGGVRGFSGLFPGLDIRLVTLPINFLVPLGREYILSMGCVNSKKDTFRKNLARGPGSSLVVVVGGAEESMSVTEGGMQLVLEKRKGFVREAIKANANLVPVLAYGENDLYKTIHLDKESFGGKLQRAFKKVAGFNMPLFVGRSMFVKSGGFMPRRTPLTIVVGKPLPPPPIDEARRKSFKPKFEPTGDRAPANDDGVLCEEHHRAYVNALLELYNSTKNMPWNAPGLARNESLRIFK